MFSISKRIGLIGMMGIGLMSTILADLNDYRVMDTVVAGFRSSRILNSYPNRIFPSADYWVSVGKIISGKFNLATPASVWIVSLYISNGVTQLGFPSSGVKYPSINFVSSDLNDAYLTRLDSEGFKVWLQVEPGAASMDTLIELVLTRYNHHPCVAGFGIDVEWFYANTNSGGRKVTDQEAQQWEAKVKSINPNYTLFLKHYSISWMPPKYRGSIIFIDDSQGFSSLNQIISEFKSWGNAFSNNKVAFQVGYEADQWIWNALSDPVKDLGDKLFSAVPNMYAFYWVDFTIVQLFPTVVNEGEDRPDVKTALISNFPNPFNSSTTIHYTLSSAEFVRIDLFNMEGQKVRDLYAGFQSAGQHNVRLAGRDQEFNPLSAGQYLIELRGDHHRLYRKIMLLK